MKEGEKYMMLPSGHPLIAEYAGVLDNQAMDNKKDLFIAVKPSTIEEGDISFIAALLMAAQHKKEWIETLLFNISFNFLREEYSEDEYLTIEEWGSSPAYQRWFHTMNQRLSFSIFFLKSDDARLFSIQGDFLHDMLTSLGEREGERLKVEVPAEKVNLINNRLFWSCNAFYTYCSGMHVKAKEYIDALLAEQDAHFDFKQVHKDWLKNEYKMVPSKGGKDLF
jgi:hypothetical protein